MNWIGELCDLYDKNETIVGEIHYKIQKGRKEEKKGQETKEIKIPLVLLPVFHTTVAAQITVTIDEEGNYIRAEAAADDNKLTIIPTTEASGSRTAGTEPHPLCDNLKYLAGDYMQYYFQKGKIKDYAQNNTLYLDALEQWAESAFSHKKVRALYSYLSKKRLVTDLIADKVLQVDENGSLAEKVKIQNIPQEDAFVRFCIESTANFSADFLGDQTGQYRTECWLDKTLQQSYIQYYKSVFDRKGLCYFTGQNTIISYLQPRKIRNEGDSAKLISSNDNTYFTYRGRFATREEAYAIGYETSQKAHNALKWIIRKQGTHAEGLCTVVWESDLHPLPSWIADTDAICDGYEQQEIPKHWDDWDEEEEEYRGTGTIYADRFQKAMQGYGKLLAPASKVILLSLDAATPGRLALQENQEFLSSHYLSNLAYWHESSRWIQSKYKDGTYYQYQGMAGVKDIAAALYGTEQNGMLSLSGKMSAEVSKRLLPCIAEHKKIPFDLVQKAVQKASSPVSYEKWYNWEQVLGIACALVKKYKYEQKKEDWTVALNESCNNRDYLYGRLLAVADRIEYRTFDKDKDGQRVTNAKRFMCAFSQRPYQTWQVIEEKIQPYLQKLNLPERLSLGKLMDQIYEKFQEDTFCDNSKLDGLYLLGYHSQSYVLKNKKTTDSTKTSEEIQNQSETKSEEE